MMVTMVMVMHDVMADHGGGALHDGVEWSASRAMSS